MDALPPNDPNRHNAPNNNHNKSVSSKNVEVTTTRGQAMSTNRPRLNERGEMDVFLGGGNLGDDIMVAAMVLMGAVAWILREVCVCR
jgi:hypothetical protein